MELSTRHVECSPRRLGKLRGRRIYWCRVQLKLVQNGFLIVLHDGYYGGDNVAQIADCLIPHLIAPGYKLMTIDRLWQRINANTRGIFTRS